MTNWGYNLAKKLGVDESTLTLFLKSKITVIKEGDKYYKIDESIVKNLI